MRRWHTGQTQNDFVLFTPAPGNVGHEESAMLHGVRITPALLVPR